MAILNWGCVLRDWRVDGPGRSLPMVLGFPSLEDYALHSRSHGAIVGRLANRTKDARFTLEGRTYELTRNHGPGKRHHIHGGATGLGRRVWAMETDGAAEAVRLVYRSPDGEEGYPGTVDFEVTYRLEGPRLVCEMRGTADRPTPLNLAHHAYFNLGGGGTVKDHILRVDAEAYTTLDSEQIPTGEIAPVEGTPLDFREPREIGDAAIDNNFVLAVDRDPQTPAAWAFCPRTDRRIEVRTDQPGLQLFDAPTMTVEAAGHDGERYGPFAGLCFEAQHFPDTMNHPDWPSVVYGPDRPYFQRYMVDITRA